MDGVDIMPLLTGTGSIEDRPLYWHSPHYNKSGPSSSAIIGEWKVIRNADDGDVELYHLAKDPREKNNLAAQNPEKAQQMAQQMTNLLEGVDYQPVRPNPDYTPR